MKTKNKIHLQCGYEDECKHKECFRCRKHYAEYCIKLSVAEKCAIEDFAVCDIKQMIKEKPKEVELMQKVMYRIMTKVFKQEGGE